MVPKVESARDLARVRAAAPAAVLLPLIETAAGIDRLREIAAAPGVQRLAFGSIDLQLDLGIDGDGDELLLFRSQVVLASRLARLAAPIDGVSTAIDDGAGIEAGGAPGAQARLRRQAVHPSAADRRGARRLRAERGRDRLGRARRRRRMRRAARSPSTAAWSIDRSCAAPRSCSRGVAEPVAPGAAGGSPPLGFASIASGFHRR